MMAAAAALLLVGAIFLPPLINLGRYQRQIQSSLAASLAHPVEVSGMTLTLLPRPGVRISNFVVDSTAGYSAEPILQCSNVAAAFRLSSLWRGRLEIARISLEEPSLNLERAPDGQWNFASVLLQASRTPQAPTGRRLPRGQHRFPYIEVSSGRINFKHGAEKLPFSFMNADASIWLENPDEWEMRFAAQPVRTDINLSVADTGTIRIRGRVRRAASADQLPLDLSAEWTGAPLGQATRILLGRDLGWRGETRAFVRLGGTPGALAMTGSAGVSGLHREGMQTGSPLDLQATCRLTYRHWQGDLDGIDCRSPESTLRLTGQIGGLHTAAPASRMQLVVSRLPAASLLALLRSARGPVNASFDVGGFVDGTLLYRQEGDAPALFEGSLVGTGLEIKAEGLSQSLPQLRLSAAASHPASAVLAPSRLDLGGTQPLLVSGVLSRHGYLVRSAGSAALERLLPLARSLGLPQTGLEGLEGAGTADLNLTLQGEWLTPLAGTGPPAAPVTVSGSMALHNAVFQPSYLLEPLHVASAAANFSPAELRWNGVAASLGETHFEGSLSLPLPCSPDCLRHFDLSARSIDLLSVEAALNGQDEGVVEDLLNRVRSLRRRWPPIEGTLHVARLGAGPLALEGATARIALQDERLRIESLDGGLLGGSIHLSGVMTMGGALAYTAQVELRRIGAPALAALFQEYWGPGQIDADAELRLSGTGAAELARSAAGHVHWDWSGGALPQIDASPFRRFDHWTANASAANGQLTLTTSAVASVDTAASVSGSIGSDRSLKLQISDPGTAPLHIVGTLSAPRLEPE